MRKIIFSLLVASLSFPLFAQTAVAPYAPGVTSEGAVYYLPKTALRITLQVEKTVFSPGDFCKYSERYLRLTDVPSEPSVSYRIVAVRQEPYAVADTSKVYAVEFDARTSACNVRLSEDGVLLGINTLSDGEATLSESPAQGMLTLGNESGAKKRRNPRSYLSEEILAAGSTAKMAELIAQDIYEIRESRNLLTRGQADYMPKDGEQLRLMLSQLDEQDRALTSLFTGTTEIDTTVHTFTLVPSGDVRRDILFRFSGKLGVVDADDLSGEPYYISVEDLKVVPPSEPVDPKKRRKQVNGIYVNVPGKLRATLSNARGTILTNDYPAGQFGQTELLSGALFNKRYTTRLVLHPISGAVERLDAEQPK